MSDALHSDANARAAITGSGGQSLGMGEFITIIALQMALTAFTVDIMLVALPDIVGEFALSDVNDQQFMITVYMGAFAFGHIFAGPLSDRLGRRPVLLLGLAIYTIGTGVALVADSYVMLLLARFVQGFGAAGPRVVAVAVVRDRFVGREMSRIMSFVMTVFIILPIFAPAIGAVINALASWRAIFALLLVYSIVLAAWVHLRLPETNPRRGPGARPAVSLRTAIVTIVRSRQTMGYMCALGFVFGILLSYISMAQQIFADVYGVVAWFPAVFASVAFGMIVSTFVNTRMVRTVGMRRLSHIALVGMIALAVLGCVFVVGNDGAHLLLLVPFLTVCFFLMGVILPNFNALAMEDLGTVAGTGSAFVGFMMTAAGAILGGLVGQFYDGSVRPLLFGLLIYSIMCFVIVFITERGAVLRASANTDGE